MFDIAGEAGKPERRVFACAECGYTLGTDGEEVKTLMEPSTNRLREKAERLLKKVEEVS